MKILVVEDDIKLVATYKSIFEKSYDVVTAYTIKEAKQIIKSQTIEVVLLDMMLPDGKGYEFIEDIKRQSEAIIIVVSALEEEMIRKIAYEKGADDYLIKPVTIFELEYKLKAISKRQNKNKMIIKIGDMTLDFENLTLYTAYKRVIIQHSQGVVLQLLFDKFKNGDIVSKNELANLEIIEKTDNYRIHTLVSRLRKNIEELESEKVIIENVYGRGYRLVIIS